MIHILYTRLTTFLYEVFHKINSNLSYQAIKVFPNACNIFYNIYILRN